MQILLSCAKNDGRKQSGRNPRTTLPRYAREAAELALQLATLTTEELERMLRTTGRSPRPTAGVTGSSTAKRPSPRCWPTRASYSGISPGAIHPSGISEYAQQHLNITSFLYGLLRRWTQSAATGWKGTPYCRGTTTKRCWVLAGRLTEAFPRKIHADDGILVNLASSEMKRLSDWKRIRREARIITPGIPHP